MQYWGHAYFKYWASLVAQTVKSPHAVQKTWVQSLGWEGGNGNPLQYSCLENSMDRGAWRATVHGVTGSDTTEQLSLLLHYIKYYFCLSDI